LDNLYGQPEVQELQRDFEMKLFDHFMKTADTMPQERDARH